MQIEYDRETDTLTVTLRDAHIKESEEVRTGVIADVGDDGEIVRIELLKASTMVSDPEGVVRFARRFR